MITDLKVIFVSRNFDDCDNGANALCREVSDGFQEALDLYDGSPVNWETFTAGVNTPDIQALNPQVNSVLFIDAAEDKLITRLNNVSAGAVRDTVLAILPASLDDTGQYSTDDGSVIPGIFPGEGSGFGFGLAKIPGWLKLLIVLYGVKKAKEYYDNQVRTDKKDF